MRSRRKHKSRKTGFEDGWLFRGAGQRPEIDLHALTRDEAIPRLDSFLHASFRAGHRCVWIIHGKGSGVLRLEVSRHLSGHSLVKSFGPADRTEGGSGVTRVVLSDF